MKHLNSPSNSVAGAARKTSKQPLIWEEMPPWGVEGNNVKLYPEQFYIVKCNRVKFHTCYYVWCVMWWLSFQNCSPSSTWSEPRRRLPCAVSSPICPRQERILRGSTTCCRWRPRRTFPGCNWGDRRNLRGSPVRSRTPLVHEPIRSHFTNEPCRWHQRFVMVCFLSLMCRLRGGLSRDSDADQGGKESRPRTASGVEVGATQVLSRRKFFDGLMSVYFLKIHATKSRQQTSSLCTN